MLMRKKDANVKKMRKSEREEYMPEKNIISVLRLF